MDASELEPLDAAIRTLTARAPHRLFIIESPHARKRLEAELGRQLTRLASDHEDDVDDVESYVTDVVLEAEGDVLVEVNAYPRDGGMASGYYRALQALRLPSGATVYYETSDVVENRIRALAASDMDVKAAAELGEVDALPTLFHVGGDLLEIDRHISAAAPGGWIFDALTDNEAEWVDQGQLDEGEERRAELQQAIDDSWEEGDLDPEQLRHEQETLDRTPGWFLLLSDPELNEIAAYQVPSRGHTPRLANRFGPWRKPTRELFLQPGDPGNLQHIVAAYLLAR